MFRVRLMYTPDSFEQLHKISISSALAWMYEQSTSLIVNRLYVKYSLHIFIGVVMKSKLITVNSFVKMSFRCNYEMGSYKASDETALRFLMQLDVGKLNLSSLVDNTHLNSVHQEVPVAKMLNSIITTHLNGGSYGLSVSVEDY